MHWALYLLLGLALGTALLWSTALVLCHRASQVQVLTWRKRGETGD